MSSKPGTAPLTWDDIAGVAHTLDTEVRGLLTELISARRTTASGRPLSQPRWFLTSVSVEGHIGVGGTPLRLSFPGAAGLTVISARNGVGKTSVVDAIRHVASNGQPRGYRLVERNLHHDQRSIVVTLTSGHREVQLTCGADGEVRWQEENGTPEPVPTEWLAAFERYRPVLLYPEISPVIEDPGRLHEFLKGAIDLSTLEDLLGLVGEVRAHGREAAKQVAVAYERALTAAREIDGSDLAARMADLGATPTVPHAQAIRDLVETGLPPAAPVILDLPEVWDLDDRIVEEVATAASRLQQARSRVVQGVQTVQVVLDRLLGDDGEHVAELRRQDVCPVCGSGDSDWVATATAESERLAALLQEVRAADEMLKARLARFRLHLPPALSERARATIAGAGVPSADEHLAVWQRLATALAEATVESIEPAQVRSLHARSRELRSWYTTVRAVLAEARTAATNRSVTARTLMTGWLDALDRDRGTLQRAQVADRLEGVVKGWIKRARNEIFEPIEKEIVSLWSALAGDTDVMVTGVALSGGVKQARKVTLDLRLQGTAVPKAGHEVMSTGQRNALSLATHLPRATQQASPFRFLILDDPIHAFDDWRVRYLAGQLAALATDYQIIVFTHDDRLWRALRALGHRPAQIRLDRPAGEASHVRVRDITHPSENFFEEIEQVLDAEEHKQLGTPAALAAATLALCRQAIDTEVTTRVEIVGRRLSLAEEQIHADLATARTTRLQLDLLDKYTDRAGLPNVDYTPYDEVIQLLNGAAHGYVDSALTPARCGYWVRQSRELAVQIRTVVG